MDSGRDDSAPVALPKDLSWVLSTHLRGQFITAGNQFHGIQCPLLASEGTYTPPHTHTYTTNN